VLSRHLAADLVDRWRTHDVPDLAAAIAYRVFVALIPLLVFIAGVSSLTTTLLDVHDPAERLVDSLDSALPDDAAAVLETEISKVLDGPGALAMAIGFVGALWTGSLAVNTAIKWLNNIHEVQDSRSFARRWALNVGLTLCAGILLVVSFIGFFAIQVFGRDLGGRLGLANTVADLASALRWPAAFVLVVAAAAVLYKLGPAKARENRWVSLGALAFGAAWLAGSFLFGFYLSHFASYNAAYGLLGAVLLLVAWLYITSLAFLMGAELDAACATSLGDEGRHPQLEALRPGPDIPSPANPAH
jgi:membrane protein